MLSPSVMSDSLWPHALQAPLSMESPGKNTGVGCHALLQGIFLIQGSNPGLPYFRRILYHLRHKGSSAYALYSHSKGYENRERHHLNLFSEKLFWSIKFTVFSVCQILQSHKLYFLYTIVHFVYWIGLLSKKVGHTK